MNKFCAHSTGLGNSNSQYYVKEFLMAIYVTYMCQTSVMKSSKTSTILQQRRLQAKSWR